MNKIFRIVWSQATQSWVVVSELTKAHKKQSSSNTQRSAVKFSGRLIKYSAVTLTLLSGHSAYAALNQPGTGGDIAVAFGDGSNATGGGATVALGAGSKATGGDSFAVGWEATASATRSISIGNRSTANSGNSIALGSNTQARGDGSIAIGVNAKSNNDAEGTIVIGRDAFSEGSGNGTRPNTVVGRGAYTAFGEGGNYRLNASTALGFQAGAGVIVDPDNNRKLVRNNTNADNNAEVLVKAGYGIDDNAPAETKAALQAGSVHDGLVFYRKRHINEGTAIGVESRAVGDQSIAIGGQVVAGDGVVALGGNDSDALRDNKYQVVTDNAVRNTSVSTIDDYNLAYTESTNTVAGQYQKLVGRGMPGSYKSTYGQSGSVVIGMHAHSTTALGTAIGTNSVVRMGAFGATAIGAGSTVQANAEAAVAIGMGSVANGAYSLAAGTASWAEYGDIALGYQAKASGKDGAIAMGRATNAQGDSSIMIGGANIESASKQSTNYEKANGQTIDKTVIEKINGQDITRKYSFAATTTTSGTVAEAYKELTGRDMNVSAIDFANTSNKNGHASTSLGVHSLAKGNLATAIGAGSRADAIGSVALGVGAQATRQNAVAIGTGSTTDFVGTRQLSVNYDSDGNIVSDDSKDIAYTFKWAGGINTSEGDVVSFGSSGAERQLKNVAAGRVAEDSTDAINGSQLNSITKRIAAGFKTSGNVVTDSSGVFTSKKANTDSAKKDYETAIRSEDKVQLQVGNNLKLDRNETEDEIDVQDDFDKKKTVKKKIKKADFAYSLNPVLTNLTSAEFKGSDANAPTTKLTNEGVTITPVTAGKNPVSLTENGLDNGGNAISNVAGNLPSTKNNDAAETDPSNATKSQDAPTLGNTANQVNPTNAATVSDVLNAGWNIQGDGKAVDFVKPYDTVNFVKGDGTSVAVESADGKTSTVKYSVNLGNGLDKDSNNNITVKAADKSLTVDTNGVKVNPADKSLEVTDAGLKVKAGDKTLTTDENGLKVNTGDIESVTTGANPGTVKVKDEDTGKIATVDSVVKAVNSAAFTLKASANGGTRNTGSRVTETGESIKAGSTVEMIAGKNLDVKHDTNGKITFATVDNPSFSTVQVGGDQGPKLSKTDEGDLKVSGQNGTDPVKITNVKPGEISETSTDAINGSQIHGLVKNTIKLAGKNGETAAGETEGQALNKEGGIKFTVKSSDGSLLEVAAEGDTITLTPKTGKITTGADGVPTANTDGGKLVTADQLVTALTEMGWKATADKEGTGTVEGNAEELIKAGSKVTFKAGDNLAVKQAGKDFIYSLKTELTGLTSAEFKNAAGDKTVINGDGVTITPVTNGKQPVSLTTNGLNNGGNPITNVAGNLDGAKAGTDAPTTKHDAPNTTEATGPNYVNPNNAATVGDVLQAGWNLQNNGTEKDFVKPYDTVNFVDGNGTTAVVETTENKTSTVKYSVNLGDGLEKDATTNKIKAKAGNGVTVDADGIKVNTGKGLKIDATDGNKVAVNTDDKTITVGDDGKVKAVTGSTEAVTADNKTGTEKVGQVRPVETDKGKLATVDTVAQAVNSAKWIAKATNTGADIEDADKTDDSAKPGEGIAAGDEVTFTAGKNLRVKREGKNFTFATDKNVSFDSVKVGDTQNGKAPVNLTTEGATTANNNEAGKAPTTALNISSGTDAKPTQLVGVGSVLNKETINTTPAGTVPAGTTPADLVNLNGTVNKNAAATVGDLQNMGWVVSSDKATDGTGEYKDVVKNANEVRFVGEGTAVVSGKTDGNVRTITVKVDDQVSTNNAVTPVVYTKADGTKVYPTGKKDAAGNLIFNTKADGTGDDVPSTDVITSVNGPKGTKAPTTLSNVEGNLDGAKTGTTAPTTNHAGVDTTNPTATNYVNPHNAATVGDVLNAGWNLQNNGAARDFVKPYDTVNFVNGGNTVAVVTTNADKTASNVTFNVTGLPVATTVNTADGPVHLAKVGDNYYPVKGDGTPNIETNAGGNPTNGYVKADNGKYYPADNVTFTKNPDTGVTTITPKPDAKPVTFGNTLTNPNVNNTDAAPNNSVTTPTSLGNVKNNLDNVNDGTEEITKPDGTVVPKKDDKANVTHGPITAEEAAKLANPKLANGKPNPEYIGNNAATVSDVLNAGFNVQGNGKAVDFVKPYDTVNFRDGGNTTVSVTTDDNLTTHVTYNVTGLPVANTITDNGKEIPVVKVGNTFYPANPDGTPNIVKDQAGNPTNGYVQANDGKVYPRDAVTITENPDGTTTVEPKAGKTPTTVNTNVVNPNVANTKDNPGNTVNTPTKVGNVTSGLDKYGDQVNGAVVPGSNDKNRGLVDLSKPANGEPKVSDNTAATVGDLRNMGWIVSSDKTTGDLAKDYSATVRNANEVKFIGKNGIQVSGKTDAEGVRTLTFEMEAGEVTPTEITKADGTKLVKVGDKVYKPEDIGTDGQPKQGKDPVGTIANDGKVYNNGDVTNGAPNNGANPIDGITVTPNNGSKFVTGNQVADAIEKSGFVVGKNNKALSASDFENKDEKVNPNDELRFADGDNTNVKLATKEVLDASGKVKTVTTVKVDVVDLPVKYTDADGNIVKKGEDGKYYNPKDLEGKVYDPTTKEFKNSDGTALAKQPEAKNNIVSSLVNPNDAKDGKVGTPSTLTNVASGTKTIQPEAGKTVKDKDNKELALANNGKWYEKEKVGTDGKPVDGATPLTPVNPDKAGLADLDNSKSTNALSVEDAKKLGWVVGTPDNNYNDQVRNANKVDFKGGNGIEVTGKTTADGIREITVGIKEGEVTNKVTITHADGTKTDAVKIGDNYYKVDKDGKPVGFDKGPDGKPAGTPLNVDPNTDKVTNAGAGFVTGNTVANAIQDSGWNVGIGSTDKDFSKDAQVYDKVNPNDEVKFANGANTNVSMVTVDALNKDGTKKATTFVKVDINRDLKIDSVTTGGTATDKNGNNLVKVGDKYYKESDIDPVTKQPKENAKPVPPADVIPAKDGAMIVKNADGKDVVYATVGKDGSGVFGVNGKDGKDGVSITAKDGEGTIGVNGKDGKNTSITGESITIKDKDNKNSTNIGIDNITLKDEAGNTNTSQAAKTELKDKAGNTNTSTSTAVTLADKDKNTNTSTAAGTTYTDKDENKTVVGPKEISLRDKEGNNTASLTNKDLLLNAKDPNTGVDKTSHVSGDKIAFTTTDEMEKVVDKDGKPVIDPDTGKQKEVVKMEKVFDKDGKPVIDPATGKQKEVVKNPGNSTEYTNEGLRVVPNSTVARDVNGNPTFLDKNGKPVMKDTDGKYKYVGQDGKPGEKYTDAVGSLKPNVVDNTRVISFGMDKPVLDKNGKPVTGPDGNPVMTEGISAGMQRVHNVAPGRISPTSTDAVNGSQLYAVASNIGNLNNKINKVGKHADAGTASALAAANIPQAYTPGKSLVGIAAGSYQGQTGVAVGMSRISDNGKIIIRLSGTTNTQGRSGVAAGVGYQW